MQIPIWLDRVSRGLILPNQVNNTGGRGCQSQLGPVSDAREICNIYGHIKIAYSQYVGNMWEICKKYVGNMSEICQKRNVREICKVYVNINVTYFPHISGHRLPEHV